MLTHVDEKNLPTMVDITDKSITSRVARAQSIVQLPEEMRIHLKSEELYLKKGPVFQTAIIAGTMAAKKTHEIIPFCHQIPIESCKFEITMNASLQVRILCEVKTTFKTGVEMEALNGATSAALTVYDMCKAVSHEITILETKLLAKSGGKHLVEEKAMYGLILTGGKSERMESDKALLSYHGIPQAEYLRGLLAPYCQEVYLSARKNQWAGTPLSNLPTLEDGEGFTGPINGMLSAFEKHPNANWFVVACDLFELNQEAIETLLRAHAEDRIVTAFKNSDEDFPEALCAIYTPNAQAFFREARENDIRCPVKVLRNAGIRPIPQASGMSLANINTKEEYRALSENA